MWCDGIRYINKNNWKYVKNGWIIYFPFDGTFDYTDGYNNEFNWIITEFKDIILC